MVDLEKNFRNKKYQLEKYLQKNEKPPAKAYFELKDEYSKLIKENRYKDKNNINRLFIDHNFYPIFSTYYLYHKKDYLKFTKYFLKGIFSLIKRHKIKPYSNLDGMIAKFVPIALQYKEVVRTNGNNIPLNINTFIKIMEIYDKNINVIFEETKEIKANNLNKLFSILIESNLFIIETNQIEVTQKNVGAYLTLLKIIKNLAKYINNSGFLTFSYKLSRMLLFYFVKYGKNIKENEEHILFVCDCMNFFSKKALKVYEKQIKNKTIDEKIVKSLTLKILDVLNSEYFYSLYVEGNLNHAWIKIEEIKNLIFTKIFDEGIDIEENTLNYFLDEWKFLLAYLKILILKSDIASIKKDINLPWMKDLNTEVIKSLESLEKQFKFAKIKEVNEYTLRIVTKSLGGHLSEFFVYSILNELVKNCPLYKNKINLKLPNELLDIISYKENLKVHLNYKIPLTNTSKETDIDIFIENKNNKLAIFFKNQKLKNFKQINNELESTFNFGVNTVIYCINVIKNLDKLQKLKEYKERFDNIYIIDIKDFTDELIKFGKISCKKSPINFPKMDLFKIIDY